MTDVEQDVVGQEDRDRGGADVEKPLQPREPGREPVRVRDAGDPCRSRRSRSPRARHRRPPVGDPLAGRNVERYGLDRVVDQLDVVARTDRVPLGLTKASPTSSCPAHDRWRRKAVAEDRRVQDIFTRRPPSKAWFSWRRGEPGKTRSCSSRRPWPAGNEVQASSGTIPRMDRRRRSPPRGSEPTIVIGEADVICRIRVLEKPQCGSWSRRTRTGRDASDGGESVGMSDLAGAEPAKAPPAAKAARTASVAPATSHLSKR